MTTDHEADPLPTSAPPPRQRRKKSFFRRRLYHPLVLNTLRVNTFLLRRLPLSVARPLARALGHLSYAFLSDRIRRRGLLNLAVAHPERSDAELESLLRETYLNQGVCFQHGMALVSRPEQTVALHPESETVRARIQSVLDEGKGLILVTGHLGAWEVLNLLVSQWFPMTMVARRSRTPAMNRMMDRIRTSNGGKVAYHDDSPRELMRALGRNEIVAIVADVPFRDVATREVEFFGHPTAMPTAPLAIARQSGAPMLFIASVLEGDHYQVVMDGPHHVERSGDRDGDIATAHQPWAAFLERVITAHPQNWVPVVDSWKKMKVGETGGP